MWGRGSRGKKAACSTLCRLSVTSPATHNRIGPFWCCFPGVWVCVCSGTLWVSPMNSPVRLGVSPTDTSTPTSVFNQWFEALLPCTGTLGCLVYRLVHQLLPRRPAEVLPTCVLQSPPCSESYALGCPSLPLVPVWLSVSSLTPWLLGFYTVRFCQLLLFFVFKLLLSFFWLCEEIDTVCLPTPPVFQICCNVLFYKMLFNV